MNQIVLLVIQLKVATVKNKNVLLLASYSTILSSYWNLFYTCWPPLIEISAPVT